MYQRSDMYGCVLYARILEHEEAADKIQSYLHIAQDLGFRNRSWRDALLAET